MAGADEAVVIKLRAEIDDVKKSMDKLNKTIAKSTKKMSGDFKALGGDILKNFATAFSIKALGQGIKNLSEMAAKAEGVKDSFDLMVESAGKTADVFRGELRAASRGTISDLQLMTKTNQALILLGKESVGEIPKLIEIARASAKATGESVDFLFDSIVLGLGRQSKMILDNLGIMVSVEKANQEYAKSLDITASELTDAQKKQAFFNATMKAGEKIIADVGDSTNLATDAQSRMNASIENASLELGKKLLPRWQRFVTLIGRSVSEGGALITWIDNIIKAVEDFGVSAGAAFAKVVNAIKFAVRQARAFKIFLSELMDGPAKAMENFLRRSKQSQIQFETEGAAIQKSFAEEIREIWRKTEEDKTKSTKKGVKDRHDALVEGLEGVKKVGKSEVEFFREQARVTVAMLDALTTKMSESAEIFVQKAGESNELFAQRVKDAQTLTQERAKATFDAIKQFSTEVTEVFAENFAIWTQGMIEGTMTVAQAFERLAKSMLKFLLEAIGKGLIQQAAAKVAEAIAAGLGIFTSAAAPGLFAAAAKLAAVGGIILGAASAIKLGEGGLVTRATSAVIGEKGPELVIPLDKLKGFTGGINLAGSTFAMNFPNVRREEDLRGGRFAKTGARQLAEGLQGLDQRSGVKLGRRG